MKDLLEDAKAELYEADPDGFTARRQELSEQAREAGQPAVAKQIAALRKPTRSAWVVNRLVRTDPGVRSRLDDLAADLREASGGGRLRELTAARAKLVDELTRTALEGVAAPPAAMREEVTATFDAAIADPEAQLADLRQRLAEARRRSYRAESRQQRAAGQLSRLKE